VNRLPTDVTRAWRRLVALVGGGRWHPTCRVPGSYPCGVGRRCGNWRRHPACVVMAVTASSLNGLSSSSLFISSGGVAVCHAWRAGRRACEAFWAGRGDCLRRGGDIAAAWAAFCRTVYTIRKKKTLLLAYLPVGGMRLPTPWRRRNAKISRFWTGCWEHLGVFWLPVCAFPAGSCLPFLHACSPGAACKHCMT